MDYEMLENKVKEFVLKELEYVKDLPSERRIHSGAMAYGALMFCEELFPSYNEELADWWRNEVWRKFYFPS